LTLPRTSTESFPIRYSSSVREVKIATTLKRAKQFSRKLGITRVTNVTRLDRVGIPVFCSIRPDAQRGSLCVNAGKGLTEEEACAGAYMEAIEFALAEFGASSVRALQATPRDLLGGSLRPDAILDFCPAQNQIIPLNGPLQCVEAEEIITATQCLVPAEQVFMPYPESLGGIRGFGSSTNGLCSGNSVLEASVHGIVETIERDIDTFQIVRNTSALLLESSYPESIAFVAAAIREAGMVLFVRYSANEFGMPHFKAIVYDPMEPNPIYVCAGVGCHVDRSIALTRAVCEALQSRLSFIHGGRDDLTKRYDEFRGWDQSRIRDYTNYLIQRASYSSRCISFDQVPGPGDGIRNLNTIFQILTDALDSAGIHRICRVVFTRPEDPLHVIRIIIPKLEFYDPVCRRVGVRLRDHVRQ
jgi:ribosomal protein S12 methylthiotransferase accessory factor